MKKIASVIVCFFIVAADPCLSLAAYPEKPIQLISPFAPGGNNDLSARIVWGKVSQILGQPVVVTNKPGGGSSVGINYVAKSKPDGYTLLTASAGIVLLPLITPKLPYTREDLVPIGRHVTMNYCMAIHKDIPSNNLHDFIAYAKKHPGTLSYGSSGVGTTAHLIGVVINMDSDLDLQHVPYQGENPALTALLGKHVDVAYMTIANVVDHVKSGAIKALVALANQRDPLLPQVPTGTELGEKGFVGFTPPTYHAFFAPAKIPPAILKTLEASVERALKDKQVRQKLEQLGLTISYLNSKETKQFLDNEFKYWSPVIKKANIVIK